MPANRSTMPVHSFHCSWLHGMGSPTVDVYLMADGPRWYSKEAEITLLPSVMNTNDSDTLTPNDSVEAELTQKVMQAPPPPADPSLPLLTSYLHLTSSKIFLIKLQFRPRTHLISVWAAPLGPPWAKLLVGFMLVFWARGNAHPTCCCNPSRQSVTDLSAPFQRAIQLKMICSNYSTDRRIRGCARCARKWRAPFSILSQGRSSYCIDRLQFHRSFNPPYAPYSTNFFFKPYARRCVTTAKNP